MCLRLGALPRILSQRSGVVLGQPAMEVTVLKEFVLEPGCIRMGNFTVSFERTLRIPDDGNTYPLPPGLGEFPILTVADYADSVPETWVEHGVFFIPMDQREAMWLAFQGASWRPNAIKIGIGNVNALTGKRWTKSLGSREQDYVVVPDQPWLDGINAGDGFIKQFVAMPLGMGYTVEGQITGKEEVGGIQIICYEPKRGKFPVKPKQRGSQGHHIWHSEAESTQVFYEIGGSEMGLGAGGRMRQKIYPDPHGVETWSKTNRAETFVHIVNSMMYREITGKEPPLTPVTAKMYTYYG